MTTIVINKNLVVNDRPLIEVLARKNWKRQVPLKQIVRELKREEQVLEPGDYLACADSKELKENGFNVVLLKQALHHFLKKSPDADLIYDNIVLARLVQADEIDPLKITLSNPVEIASPGDTAIVSTNISTDVGDIELIHPSGVIESLGHYDSNLFNIRGFSPSADGQGRLEITHFNGFNVERHLQIPVHTKVDNKPIPAILNVTVKLPPRGKEKIVELKATIEEDGNALIDIGKEGLHVPNGDVTFTQIIKHSFNAANVYHLYPRVINGLIIEPTNFGKTLSVKPAISSDREPKSILTHLLDKNDRVIPVNLKVDFKDRL